MNVSDYFSRNGTVIFKRVEPTEMGAILLL